MITVIYIDVDQHLNTTLSHGPLKETKNDTDAIPDYGRHRRDRRPRSTPATRERARGAGTRPSARRAIGAVPREHIRSTSWSGSGCHAGYGDERCGRYAPARRQEDYNA